MTSDERPIYVYSIGSNGQVLLVTPSNRICFMSPWQFIRFIWTEGFRCNARFISQQDIDRSIESERG